MRTGRSALAAAEFEKSLKLDPANGKTWTVPVDNIEGEGVSSAAVLVQSGTPERPGLMLGAALASLR